MLTDRLKISQEKTLWMCFQMAGLPPLVKQEPLQPSIEQNPRAYHSKNVTLYFRDKRIVIYNLNDFVLCHWGDIASLGKGLFIRNYGISFRKYSLLDIGILTLIRRLPDYAN